MSKKTDDYEAGYKAALVQAIALARGCTDYKAGFDGPMLYAFHGGILLVGDILEKWAAGNRGSQLQAVHNIGADAVLADYSDDDLRAELARRAKETSGNPLT